MLNKSYIFLGIGLLFLVATFYLSMLPLLIVSFLFISISLYYGIKNINANHDNINNLIPVILSSVLFIFMLLFSILLIILFLGIGAGI